MDYDLSIIHANNTEIILLLFLFCVFWPKIYISMHQKLVVSAYITNSTWTYRPCLNITQAHIYCWIFQQIKVYGLCFNRLLVCYNGHTHMHIHSYINWMQMVWSLVHRHQKKIPTIPCSLLRMMYKLWINL